MPASTVAVLVIVPACGGAGVDGDGDVARRAGGEGAGADDAAAERARSRSVPPLMETSDVPAGSGSVTVDVGRVGRAGVRGR